MGLHTVIMIDNDRIEEIEADPEGFCKELCKILQRGGNVKMGGLLQAAHSVPKSDTVVYVADSNELMELSDAKDSPTCCRRLFQALESAGIGAMLKI